MSETELVKKDLEALYLGNLGTVEFDLELPKTGVHGSEITWQSGNTAFLSHGGKVSRPAYGRGNREVILTACVRNGGYEEKKEFTVTILEENNRIEVTEIYPIILHAEPKKMIYFPQAAAVKTKDGRVIAHFIEWDGGAGHCFEKEGEYPISGNLKDTKIPVNGTVCVKKKENKNREEVKLLESSRFFDAQERMHLWLLHSDPDQWLYNFRRAAGLPVGKAVPLSGWDSPEGLLRGHTTGHYLSSLALCWKATKDEKIREKAVYMAKELKKCQDAFAAQPQYHKGFLSAYSEEQFNLLETYTPYPKIWAPYYTLHKILAGLLDLYEYAGIETAKIIAEGIGDWVYERLSRLPHEQRTKMWSIYIAGEYGGMNEVMAKLYGITKKEHYLEAARYFDNDRLFYPLEQGVDALDGMHANQHIPQVIGAMAIYGLTKEKRYKTIAKRFWNFVTESHTYAPGGTGESEMFHEAGNITGLLTKSTQESCASYNMLKLTAELYRWEQKADYMDYYERTVYNHILSSCDQKPSSGSTYFLSMKPKAVKDFDASENSCCHGTGLESHFKYGENIYFVKEDEIYVNLFIPSVLRLPDLELSLRSKEQNPGEISLHVKGDGKRDLFVRVPRWADGKFSVRINGKEFCVKNENGYLHLKSEWYNKREPNDGETDICISYPCRLFYEPAKDNPEYRTLWYGPWLLAALTEQEEVLCLRGENPDETLIREEPETIQFRDKESGIRFIPLANVWKEEYQVYIR